jgi:hypothetical protein
VDSLTIHNYLTDRGLSVPGARTTGDNVNALSEETPRLILRCQLMLLRYGVFIAQSQEGTRKICASQLDGHDF